MEKGFLKEKLGDFQVNPPDKVWDSIASQLGGRSRRRMIIITLSAAATIALAVMLGINYFGPVIPDSPGIAESLENASQSSETTQSPEISQLPETTQSPQISQLPETTQSPQISQSKETTLSPETSQTLRAAQTEISTVARAIEEIATEPHYEAGEKPIQSVAMVETTTSAVSELEAKKSEEELSTEKSVDVILDPEIEINGDPPPEIPVEQNRSPKWIVGAALSPLYSFRDAEASAMANASEYESGMVAYSGGVHVSFKPASRLAIESGVFFSKMGISIGAAGIQLFNRSLDFSPLSAEAGKTGVTTITNSVGNIIATSGDVFVNNYLLNAASESNEFLDPAALDSYAANEGIQQHLDYLELPFNLRYTVIDKTIELQLVGGVSTNFLVSNYVTMETTEGPVEIGYLTNIRSVNYSGNAGLGMIYHVHEKISLRLEPRFRYFLNSVNDATLPTTRPYALGLFTGLSYTF